MFYVQCGHGWHKHKILADSMAESLSLNVLMLLLIPHVPTGHDSSISSSRRTMQGFDILILNNDPILSLMYVCMLMPSHPPSTKASYAYAYACIAREDRPLGV